MIVKQLMWIIIILVSFNNELLFQPNEVDMIMASLEGFVGSVGGFCVGTHFIIEHQRLSGLGNTIFISNIISFIIIMKYF